MALSSTPRQHRSPSIAEQIIAVLLLTDARADERLIRPFHSADSDEEEKTHGTRRARPPTLPQLVPSGSADEASPHLCFDGRACWSADASKRRRRGGQSAAFASRASRPANRLDLVDCRIPIDEQQRGTGVSAHTRSSSDPAVSAPSIWRRLAPAPPPSTSLDANAETAGSSARAFVWSTPQAKLLVLFKLASPAPRKLRSRSGR
jgi:hypothetical protein